jgi:hypothetical protein
MEKRSFLSAAHDSVVDSFVKKIQTEIMTLLILYFFTFSFARELGNDGLHHHLEKRALCSTFLECAAMGMSVINPR